ncbi:polysaccharide deacetylase family protein [Sphingobacterium yanglingense]|uniref:polysaccharide deacetylase family protein n=1 Tax=Sphingobacterium yanglingense TaxID=1437280 RepID=UPI001FE8BABC|nr:polysaccharide deacetylase family protein [Sphingobacterium yanglingense]
MSLVFTGDEFREGLPVIADVLGKKQIKASFFITGNFLKDEASAKLVRQLIEEGHYVGPHSDEHLLYMPWGDRSKLLLSKRRFTKDLKKNIKRLEGLGAKNIKAFIPPYEWYNVEIVQWAEELGLKVYNYTPGLRTPADYTFPGMGDRYWSASKIMNQLWDYERANNLNGYVILMHIGTDSRREDKLYNRLEEFIDEIQSKSYKFVTLEKL